MDGDNAFLLINCDVGTRQGVKEILEELDEVKEVSITNGVYDIIVKIESKTKEQFKSLIDKIRHTDNVRVTLTLTKIKMSNVS